MSNPRPSPVERFVRPSLGCRCSKCILHLTTCPHFVTFGLEIFDAGGPQFHFITSVAIAVRIGTLSVH